MIKFLPAYTGGKSSWVKRLQQFNGMDFIEVFAGSAVLSANLAKTAWVNDIDPILYKVYSNYGQLLCPNPFDKDDYYKVRMSDDWWRYIYILQKMSYGSIFRYSKNGYNVPIDKTFQSKSNNVYSDFANAQTKFKELSPKITNLDYKDVFNEITKNKSLHSHVIILDHPYPNTQTTYNNINHDEYYSLLKDLIINVNATFLIFSTTEDLEYHGYEVSISTKMNLSKNKGYKCNSHGVSIIERRYDGK